MAKEILILDQQPPARGGRRVNLLFFFFVDPLIVAPDPGGEVIVPTPAVDLPQLVAEMKALNLAELALLDSGAAVFETCDLFLTEAESSDAATALAIVRAKYAASTFVADLRQEYAFAGIRIDA